MCDQALALATFAIPLGCAPVQIATELGVLGYLKRAGALEGASGQTALAHVRCAGAFEMCLPT